MSDDNLEMVYPNSGQANELREKILDLFRDARPSDITATLALAEAAGVILSHLCPNCRRRTCKGLGKTALLVANDVAAIDAAEARADSRVTDAHDQHHHLDVDDARDGDHGRGHRAVGGVTRMGSAAMRRRRIRFRQWLAPAFPARRPFVLVNGGPASKQNKQWRTL